MPSRGEGVNVSHKKITPPFRVFPEVLNFSPKFREKIASPSPCPLLPRQARTCAPHRFYRITGLFLCVYSFFRVFLSAAVSAVSCASSPPQETLSELKPLGHLPAEGLPLPFACSPPRAGRRVP
jgi:hypothetical protein